LKNHFNIILPSTLMVLKWSLPVRFRDQNSKTFLISFMCATYSGDLEIHDLITIFN
jgi:hypothetical protein